MTEALLILDMQNDFLSGGSLAVKGADALIPRINELMKRFPYVVASQDWHPADHTSFKELWPVHCVQGSKGAELASGLDRSKIDRIIQKGTDKWLDSYSAFFDVEHGKPTALKAYLDEHDIDTLYLVGVATDYCVYYTALDALDLGFKVVVLKEACRAIGDGEKALESLKAKGAKIE